MPRANRKCLQTNWKCFQTNGKCLRQTGSASNKHEVHTTNGKCLGQLGSATNKQEVLPANRKCHTQEMQIFGNVGNLDLDGNVGRTGNTGVLMSCAVPPPTTSSLSCRLSTLVSPGFGKKKNQDKKKKIPLDPLSVDPTREKDVSFLQLAGVSDVSSQRLAMNPVFFFLNVLRSR